MSSLHLARIHWSLGDADFTGRRYSRAHTWAFDGGLVVPASASPHIVPVPLSDPRAVDPEEAFVAALASCHLLWFLDLAARGGYTVAEYADDAEGRMGRDAAGRPWIELVRLRPRVRFDPARRPALDAFLALHHQAHDACFLARSVRSEMHCDPEIVG